MVTLIVDLLFFCQLFLEELSTMTEGRYHCYSSSSKVSLIYCIKAVVFTSGNCNWCAAHKFIHTLSLYSKEKIFSGTDLRLLAHEIER